MQDPSGGRVLCGDQGESKTCKGWVVRREREVEDEQGKVKYVRSLDPTMQQDGLLLI